MMSMAKNIFKNSIIIRKRKIRRRKALRRRNFFYICKKSIKFNNPFIFRQNVTLFFFFSIIFCLVKLHKLTEEVFNVGKLAVNRGKAYVSDLVSLL